MRDPPLIVGASRPLPGESANGDAWTTLHSAGTCLIAVFDGLGHGPNAAAVADVARAALLSRASVDPLESLEVCHRALAGSRGAALLLVAIDLAASRLTYAGVGNVEARLWQGGVGRRLIGQRGILGAFVAGLRAYQAELSADWQLVIFTDGISARLELAPPTDRSPEAVDAYARELLNTRARPTDDATVVIACPKTLLAPLAPAPALDHGAG